jgi:hypothetical protein
MALTDPAPPSRNPPWSRDELILALDLYVRSKGNPPGKSSPEIMGLSSLLNRIAGGSEGGTADFRNPNGVYMKLMNFRRFDPVYQEQGKTGLTRGNKLQSGSMSARNNTIKLYKSPLSAGAGAGERMMRSLLGRSGKRGATVTSGV